MVARVLDCTIVPCVMSYWYSTVVAVGLGPVLFPDPVVVPPQQMTCQKRNTDRNSQAMDRHVY
uniref:Uncharacterized protein n=2 Tax=Oryza TaxID=4527 RepID=A0A0E0NS71_ORYRU